MIRPIKANLSVNVLTEEEINIARQSLKVDGYSKLSNLFSNELFQQVKDEVVKLKDLAFSKKFKMPKYNTARFLSTIGAKLIAKNTELIPFLYYDSNLKDILEEITEEPLFHVNHEEESFVVNYLMGIGQTHGWHLDDPKYAFVTVFDMPHVDFGGHVEIIKDWKAICSELNIGPQETLKGVEFAEKNKLIKKVQLKPGESYILNAADCLHRVAPMEANSIRSALNLAFHPSTYVSFDGTADILYGRRS